jgi:hypothetical protein
MQLKRLLGGVILRLSTSRAVVMLGNEELTLSVTEYTVSFISFLIGQFDVRISIIKSVSIQGPSTNDADEHVPQVLLVRCSTISVILGNPMNVEHTNNSADRPRL